MRVWRGGAAATVHTPAVTAGGSRGGGVGGGGWRHPQFTPRRAARGTFRPKAG
jgi:hypothetical protein